jgi:hypothetical protein
MYVSSSHWNLEFEQSWLLLQKAPTNKIMIWAVQTFKEELVHNQMMEFFALKGGGWKTL